MALLTDDQMGSPKHARDKNLFKRIRELSLS
jgi:hypothetical protein